MRRNEESPQGSFPGGFLFPKRAREAFGSESLLQFLFGLINAPQHFIFVELNKSSMFLFDRSSDRVVRFCLKKFFVVFPFFFPPAFFYPP